jgi:hypothetical protein
MCSLVLGFQEIETTQLTLVGGKGLNLGRLSTIQGIQVPEGFSVTTAGYQKAIEQIKTFQALLDQLSMLKMEDRDQISVVSRKIRQTLKEVKIPSDVEKEVTHYLSQFGDEHAYAVRSSATAEDLPHASFAGQHDTYLNIIGKEAILQHIKNAGLPYLRIVQSFTECKINLTTDKFLSPLSFKRWFSRKLQGYYLPLTRLLLTERYYPSMPVLDLGKLSSLA